MVSEMSTGAYYHITRSTLVLFVELGIDCSFSGVLI